MLIDPRIARQTNTPRITWGRQQSGWKSHAWYHNDQRWIALCGQWPVNAEDGSLRTTMELTREGPVCATCERMYNEMWSGWWDAHAQTGE